MVFRSVTYNALEVDLDSKDKMDLKDYSEQPSGSWYISEVPLSRKYRTEYRKHGNVPIVSVQLDLIVARKSSFYICTFLLPCVCIAFLTVFVFYLPTASGEKLCLAISILFSIVIFLLILIDILPPSDSLPLMTKFLLFTFVCNLTSAVLTTVAVHWNFRTSQTYDMPNWVKTVFLERLPHYLGIRRPVRSSQEKLFESAGHPKAKPMYLDDDSFQFQNGSSYLLARQKNSNMQEKGFENDQRRISSHEAKYSQYPAKRYGSHDAAVKQLHYLGQYLRQFPGYMDALHSVALIAKNLQEQDEEEDVRICTCYEIVNNITFRLF